MRFTPANIGVHTADAERVQLQFDSGDLVLRYIDWREEPQERVFHEVLAFRWNDEFDMDDGAPRDDIAYEVHGSQWFDRQMTAQRADAERYAHYKLCFNACGVLDVICQRIAAPAAYEHED